MQRESMTKTRFTDLVGSATGYTYNQQQGVPVYYVQYTNQGSGRYYHTPDTVRYVLDSAAPVASAIPETTLHQQPYATVHDVPRSIHRKHEEAANYGNQQSLKHAVPQPRAPYYVSEKVTREKEDKKSTYDENVKEDRDDEKKELDDSEEDDDEDVHGDSNGGVIKFNYSGRGSDDGSSFEATDGGEAEEHSEHGENHKEEEHAEHGEKGESGYKKSEKHSKGEKGIDDEEHQKGKLITLKNKIGYFVSKSEFFICHSNDRL